MREQFLTLFPKGYEQIWRSVLKDVPLISEIRIRLGAPVIVYRTDGEWFLGEKGLTKNQFQAIRTAEIQLSRYISHFCHDSIYAFQEELKQGFVTLPGGHRVGVAGQVMLHQGEVEGMKHITCLNIRLAHQVKGAADGVMPFLYEEGKVLNTLIISSPGGGKTTLLRDIVRQVSEGNLYGQGVSVSVIDERSEVAGCYQGVPQNDVGIRTDILDGCPKEKGMMMMLRGMAPKVVAVDELGGSEEEKALFKLLFCGIKVIATVHGEDLEDLRGKRSLDHILSSKQFERYIFLKRKEGCPRVVSICDKNFNSLF